MNIESIAVKYNIPINVVKDIINMYGKAIVDIISNTDLHNTNIEDIENKRLSINIPKIGKLNTNKDRVIGTIKRFKILNKDGNSSKENKTNV